MTADPPASAAAVRAAALPLLASALAALTVPPPGLDQLRARLAESSAALDGLPVASLGLDSLGRMEFCIQLELDHGVPLTPDRLAAMSDLGELFAFLAAPPALPPDPLPDRPPQSP